MIRRRQILTYSLIMAMLQTFAAGPASSETASPQPEQNHVPDGFTVTAVGDLICTYPITGMLKVVSPGLLDILRNADITVGNYEDTALDLKSFAGTAQAEAGGSWLLATPDQPQDLKALGFNMVGRANNHATDWGVEGMRATSQALDRAGIAHAGTGETLAAARAPRFLEVKSVRAALIGLTSTFTPMSRAMDPLGEIPGRGGVNALRVTRIVTVSPQRLAVLEALRRAVPPTEWTARPAAGTVTLETTSYRSDPGVGDSVIRTFEIDARDERDILSNIRQGKQAADFTVVSMHSHEFDQSNLVPAAFMQAIAHKAIDAGADIFVGHGPHLLRGIEIYKGKPIFYSLANFCHMDDALQPLPRDHYALLGANPDAITPATYMHQWRELLLNDTTLLESVVAVSRFERGDIKEIRLYPIDLDALGRASRRGVPVLADTEKAQSILKRLQGLSEPFGTRIAIEDGVGIVRIGQQTASP
ncbi:CapA family protein [Bradyrhizobium prioriisuperbiae]|uniref:CapA family protein n=1 Tax=Bradyrhizobium prioriisuperbiae TaxID=2854389 RepID=UPI0028E1F27B|nr:CapA family protein [Bradyrhizobium prioritasuperba]